MKDRARLDDQIKKKNEKYSKLPVQITDQRKTSKLQERYAEAEKRAREADKRAKLERSTIDSNRPSTNHVRMGSMHMSLRGSKELHKEKNYERVSTRYKYQSTGGYKI